MMLSRIIKRVAKRFQIAWFPSLQDRELKRWYAEDSEKTKRLYYNLSSKSTVIDLGGYEGQWASDVYERFGSNVLIFEAIPAYAENIRKRFSNNPQIKVFPFALGKNARDAQMSMGGPGSSLFKGDGTVSVKVEDAGGIFAMCNILHCDLMKINIEGGEYEVLPRLIETGIINEIDHLQIQFHNIEHDSLNKMNSIQEGLAKTHERTWCYQWIWENWTRKGNKQQG